VISPIDGIMRLLIFSISNFRRVLHAVCFLLGNSPAIIYLLAYGDGTECSETSAYKIQMPGNYPEENMQQVVNT
jgi:hypothetical protein